MTIEEHFDTQVALARAHLANGSVYSAAAALEHLAADIEAHKVGQPHAGEVRP